MKNDAIVRWWTASADPLSSAAISRLISRLYSSRVPVQSTSSTIVGSQPVR